MPQQISMQHENSLDALTTEVVSGKKPNKGRRSRTAFLLFVLLTLIGLMCGFTTNFIPSDSMEPNLKPGYHILTMRKWLAYPFGAQPHRGDIIVFKLSTKRLDDANRALGMAPDSTLKEPKVDILIKRVIAEGGDKVRVDGNTIYVNDVPIHESYALTPVADTDAAVYVYADNTDYKIAEGQVFVLGDNRNNSDDSRFWGALDTDDIIGRFVSVLYDEGKNGINELRESGGK